MKILHVNDTFTGMGGVDQYILSLAILLDNTGHENVILYRQQSEETLTDSPWPTYWVQEDSNSHSQNEGSKKLHDRIEEIISKHRPDVAYIHHVASATIVETVANLLPTAAYMHGFQAVCPGLAKYFRRGDNVCQRPFGPACFPMHYLRRCSAARNPRTVYRLMQKTAELKSAFLRISHIFVATEYMRKLLIQNGFAHERISCLPPHFFPEAFRPSFAQPSGHPIVLYAGRLEMEKGVPYLLQAFRKVPAPAQLLIAGAGTLRSHYEQMSADYDLDGRVIFLGWQEPKELADLYRRCFLLVMPTICPETFGKVGVEAMSYGRPVIAFDVGGISDWLQDQRNGLLVLPKDANCLATSINALLNDEVRRMEMGQAGQELVISRFTAANHLETLLKIFRDCSRTVTNE